MTDKIENANETDATKQDENSATVLPALVFGLVLGLIGQSVLPFVYEKLLNKDYLDDFWLLQGLSAGTLVGGTAVIVGLWSMLKNRPR